SLFVGLAKAAGLPARDFFGICVAESAVTKSLGKSGDITKAQHCRAEVFIDGKGWLPVDPADVRKVALEEQLSIDSDKIKAVRERSNEKFEFPVKWGIDLQSEHERFLTEKHAKKPVIVMNYPKAIKAFYMRLNDDGRTVAAMDVLAPGIGEIFGGSQREERLEVLDRSMAVRGIDRERYAWYRDLRRYGTVPSAGFGLGFERTLVHVTG